MAHDFDRVIERRGTDCLKYDFAAKRGLPSDVLPLWVADMDIPTPPAVVEALVARSRHGIFGYSDAADECYFEALSDWFGSRFGWTVQPEWLVKTPSVVYALCAAVRALTREGEGVLIQEPVYYPFRESIASNGRTVVVNPLLLRDGRYGIDFDDFERRIVDGKVRLFLLCSPHNPVGRVWTAEELTRMGEICVRHDVLVVADEIHEDFVFPGHRHVVFQALRPEFRDRTITCTAPTKTFNLAGLQISNVFIPDSGIRRAFRDEMDRTGYSQPNVMGLVACRAAYREGGPWLDALLVHLEGNFARLRDFLAERLPALRPIEAEGTYLAWVDCRGIGLADAELKRKITQEARLWLSDGWVFGAGGSGFQRINLACPRPTLDEALQRLERALR